MGDEPVTYAILQKSTGKFLPQFKGDYGASSVEPTYQDIMPPRLFRTEADAKSARRWWLAGHWTFNEDDDYIIHPNDQQAKNDQIIF